MRERGKRGADQTGIDDRCDGLHAVHQLALDRVIKTQRATDQDDKNGQSGKQGDKSGELRR
ncbi:hypothetical protein D3C79_1072250 [compost metagenome]